MAVRQIGYREDTILRKKCKEVSRVDERIRTILEDKMDTLHSVGNEAALAANQVRILKRLVVIDYQGNYLKLVNPEIVETEGTKECIEGCLSFPKQYGKTIRPQRVVARAWNEREDEVLLTGEGDMANCFCHELDHLDGKVFVDQVIEWFSLP